MHLRLLFDIGYYWRECGNLTFFNSFIYEVCQGWTFWSAEMAHLKGENLYKKTQLLRNLMRFCKFEISRQNKTPYRLLRARVRSGSCLDERDCLFPLWLSGHLSSWVSNLPYYKKELILKAFFFELTLRQFCTVWVGLRWTVHTTESGSSRKDSLYTLEFRRYVLTFSVKLFEWNWKNSEKTIKIGNFCQIDTVRQILSFMKMARFWLEGQSMHFW